MLTHWSDRLHWHRRAPITPCLPNFLERGSSVMSASDTNKAPEPSERWLRRPVGFLQLLPIEYQWEFTRRHPYYLTFQPLAHRHYAGLLTSAQEKALGQFAVVALLTIGVSGDPPPPDASAEDALQISGLGQA